MQLIAWRWRFSKVIYCFFILEFICTIPALVLFALADPDEYRTKLWKDGFMNGFNSNPQAAIYAYANYETPHTPLVWSSFLTTWNVVISVLSMFILLVKAVMLILHIWLPIVSFFVHGGVAAIWAFSVYGQTSSDMTDPRNPQPGAPWYITKSCSVAYYKSNIGYCTQAKACLAITVIMLFIFTSNTIFAAISIIPSAKEREDRRREAEEEEEDEDDSDIEDLEARLKGGSNNHSDDNSIELGEIHTKREVTISTMAVKSPMTIQPPTYATQHFPPPNPSTPRTTAFHRLNNADLPLRR